MNCVILVTLQMLLCLHLKLALYSTMMNGNIHADA